MPPDARLPALLRGAAFSSGAFRFAMLLAGVFALGSAGLLWAVARQIDSYATEATHTLLGTEAKALADEFAAEGLAGLTAAIRYRSAARETPYHYLLVDARGQRLAGTLSTTAARLGWQTGYEAEAGDPHARMRHLGTRLPGGLLLVVASDTFDIERARDRLVAFTLVCASAIVVFAMLGGMLAGGLFLGRLERINRAVEQIIAGNAAARLPTIGIGPEFKHLTDNLNRMIERQQAASDGLRHVSSAIAHEMRTPLSRLKQRLEALRDAGGAGPDALDGAIAQVDGTLATFQSLLRIGMLEGGAGRQHFARIDLTELVQRVHQAYVPVAEDGGYELVIRTLATVAIKGDADLVAQQLTNLVENALAHTPPGTTIELGLARAGPVATLWVDDDGPGVSDAERAQLFTKFYRATTAANRSGAGLGLALVAAIAEHHDGSARIVPRSAGFRVEVTFPALPEIPAPVG